MNSRKAALYLIPILIAIISAFILLSSPVHDSANISSVPENVNKSVNTITTSNVSSSCFNIPVYPTKSEILHYINLSENGSSCALSALFEYKSANILSRYGIILNLTAIAGHDNKNSSNPTGASASSSTKIYNCPPILTNPSKSTILRYINMTDIGGEDSYCSISALSIYNQSGILHKYNLSLNFSNLERGVHLSSNAKLIAMSKNVVVKANLTRIMHNYETIVNYYKNKSSSSAEPVQNSSVSASNSLDTFNWAGYVVNSSTPSIYYVSGSWVVQNAGPSSIPTYSSQWVGIGGYLNDPYATLIQTGTESDYYNAGSNYSAWYEMLPAPETPLNEYVAPNDIMYAFIYLVPNTLNQWNITLVDETQKWEFSQIFTYNSSKLSAEWIEERPLIGFEYAHLSNFGISYYGPKYTGTPNATALGNPVTGNYCSAQTCNSIGPSSQTKLLMANFDPYTNNYSIIAYPSNLSSDNKSFRAFRNLDIPQIISSPYELGLGQNATLHVSEQGGNGIYTYEWYADSSCTGIVVGTLENYTTPNTLIDNTTYCVRVSDSGFGSSSAIYTLVVNPYYLPKITLEPRNPIIANGTSLRITANVIGGSGNFTYYWYNGTPIQKLGIGNNLTLNENGDSSTLILESVSPENLSGVSTANVSIYENNDLVVDNGTLLTGYWYGVEYPIPSGAYTNYSDIYVYLSSAHYSTTPTSAWAKIGIFMSMPNYTGTSYNSIQVLSSHNSSYFTYLLDNNFHPYKYITNSTFDTITVLNSISANISSSSHSAFFDQNISIHASVQPSLNNITYTWMMDTPGSATYNIISTTSSNNLIFNALAMNLSTAGEYSFKVKATYSNSSSLSANSPPISININPLFLHPRETLSISANALNYATKGNFGYWFLGNVIDYLHVYRTGVTEFNATITYSGSGSTFTGIPSPGSGTNEPYNGVVSLSGVSHITFNGSVSNSLPSFNTSIGTINVGGNFSGNEILPGNINLTSYLLRRYFNASITAIKNNGVYAYNGYPTSGQTLIYSDQNITGDIITYKEPSISISDPSNAVIDQGQIEEYSARVYNGIGPFYIKLFSSGSSNPVGTSTIYPNGTANTGSNTISISFNPLSGTHSYYFEATDTGIPLRSKIPANYIFNSSSNTITIASTPSLSLSITNSIIDSGSLAYFRVTESGGVGPFMVELYNATEDKPVTNSIINSPGGSTVITLKAGKDGTFRYEAIGTDTGTTVPYALSPSYNSITINPAISVNISSTSNIINFGAKATLTANVMGGTPPYSYQWYSGSSASCNLDSIISGATSQAYTASPASTTIYCIKVSDSASSSDTASYTLIVNLSVGIPSITPESAIIDQGQSINFSVLANGGVPPYSYQWYDGQSSLCTSDSIIPGATSKNYSASPESSTYYCARVQDSNSNFSYSPAALVTVDPKLSAKINPTQETYLDVGETEPVNISVSGGTPPYTYLLNISTIKGNCSTGLSEATSNTYLFTSTRSMAGCSFIFKGIVTDSAGSNVSSSSGTINVNSAPTLIISSPSNSILDYGESTDYQIAIPNNTGFGPFAFNILLGGNVIYQGQIISSGDSAIFKYTPSETGKEILTATAYDLGSSHKYSFSAELPEVIVNNMLNLSASDIPGSLNLYKDQVYPAYINLFNTDTGTPPYTYTILISNTSGSHVLNISNANTLLQHYLFNISVSSSGAYKLNASVKDSATTPTLSSISKSINISIANEPSLFLSLIGSNTVDLNQPITYLATIPNNTGFGPFSISLISGNSIVASNTISNGSAILSFLPEDAGSLSINAEAKDLGDSSHYAFNSTFYFINVLPILRETIHLAPYSYNKSYFPNANSIISLRSNSSKSIILNLTIKNVTQSYPSIPSTSSTAFTKIDILYINVTATTPNAIGTFNASLTMGYPCSYSTVAPYIYNGSSWAPVPYSTNESSCSVSLNITPDPIIGLFASSPIQSSTPPPQPSPPSGSSQSGGNGGNGGGNSNGGAGGGITKPVVTKTNATCYTVNTFIPLSTFNVTFGSSKFNFTENFISPNYAGVSIGNVAYTIYPNKASTFYSIGSDFFTLTLLNISYLPMQQAITVGICSTYSINSNAAPQAPETLNLSINNGKILLASNKMNDLLEIIADGNVIASGNGSIEISTTVLKEGLHRVYGIDLTSGKNTNTTEITIAYQVPSLIFVKKCKSYVYNVSKSCTTEAEIFSRNSSLTADLYLNGNLIGRTNGIINDTESKPGNYTYLFETKGNGYYSSQSIYYTYYITGPSTVPGVTAAGGVIIAITGSAIAALILNTYKKRRKPRNPDSNDTLS